MKAPVSLTILGILNIAFGLMQVLGLISSAAIISATVSSNPIVQVMQENHGYATFMKISMPVGFISAALLIISGIGLLRVRVWGRHLSIGYSIYAIVFSLVTTVVTYFFLMQPMLARARTLEGPEAAALVGSAIGTVVTGAAGIIYPIILLVMMNRPRLRAAFSPPAQPPELTRPAAV